MDDADRPPATRRKPSYAGATRTARGRRGRRRGARCRRAIPRGAAPLRRGGPSPPDDRRLPCAARRCRHRADGRARLPRRRGVRAHLGRVTRPGTSARRARIAARAAAEGRRPVEHRRRPRGAPRGKPRPRSRRGTTTMVRTIWPRSDSCDGSSPRSCVRTIPASADSERTHCSPGADSRLTCARRPRSAFWTTPPRRRAMPIPVLTRPTSRTASRLAERPDGGIPPACTGHAAGGAP